VIRHGWHMAVSIDVKKTLTQRIKTVNLRDFSEKLFKVKNV